MILTKRDKILIGTERSLVIEPEERHRLAVRKAYSWENMYKQVLMFQLALCLSPSI